MAEEPGNIHDYQFPSGVACLEAMLTREGHDVSFIWRVADHVVPEEVKRRIEEIQPDYICISFCYMVIREVVRLVDLVRKTDCGHVPVILGGPGVTYSPSFALKLVKADYAVLGEGEIALPKLISWLDGHPGENSKVDIQGVVSYGEAIDGTIDESTWGEQIDLTSIPLPTWDKYPLHWYMRTGDFFYRSLAHCGDRVFAWIASRGCIHSCNFCVSGCKPRFKPIPFLKEELIEIQKRFHPTFIGWQDNLAIFQKKRCLEFCEMLKELNFGWRYYVTGWAATIDREMLTALRETGCTGILYGVESANDHILANMGKKQTVEQLQRAIALTLEAGIRVNLSAMFGQPGEGIQEFSNTLRMLMSIYDYRIPISNNQGLSPVMTFPGTPLYRWAQQNGYFTDAEDHFEKFFSNRYNFINYTDIEPDNIFGFHQMARVLKDKKYYQTMTDHYVASMEAQWPEELKSQLKAADLW
jgi:radical SAM superfamily enzyme YgiQ (UPF0313 family)